MGSGADLANKPMQHQSPSASYLLMKWLIDMLPYRTEWLLTFSFQAMAMVAKTLRLYVDLSDHSNSIHQSISLRREGVNELQEEQGADWFNKLFQE